MATYVNDLRLKEIATGDESGTWGTSTNTNLELIGEALGYGTEAITTNADTHTTTVADGSTDPGRAMYIKYTGALDSDCTITIAPNTMSRVHFIENATTDSGSSGPYNIIISQGSGANVTIPNGFVKAVYLDGAGSGAAVTEAFADLSIGPNLRIGNAAAEDTAIVFDGNAQDFYIGLDDSADDLIIGLGSTVGTTPIISVDENKDVAIPDGGLTITTDDNTNQLTLISTDADANAGPGLDLYRNSSSPADDDVLGTIFFHGEDGAGNKTEYARIEAGTDDVSNGAEAGSLTVFTNNADTLTNNRFEINSTGLVINESSGDFDTRIESNGNTHMLFVDAGNDHVNFGTATDHGGVVNIESTDNNNSLVLVSTDADASFGPRLKLFRNSASAADGDAIGFMNFTGTNDAGTPEEIGYAALDARIVDASDGTEDGRLEIVTILGGVEGTSRILMDATETVFNDNSANLDFRVESDNFSHLFFVDASADGVGIGDGGTQAGGLKIQSATSTTDDIDVKLYLNARTTGTPTTGFGPGIVFAGDRNSDNATQQMARINAIAEVNSGTTLSSGLQFMTATAGTNVEKLRIANTGQLLVGTTSVPTGVQRGNQVVCSSVTGSEFIAFRADTSVAVNDLTGAFLCANSDTDGTEDHFVGMYGKVSSTNGSQDLHFVAGRSGYESDTPQMTLTSDGQVNVSTMAFGTTLRSGGTSVGQLAIEYSGATENGLKIRDTGGNAGGGAIRFVSSSSLVGTISTSTSATTYGTTSDYRLKDNVTYDWDGLTRLKQLKPARFTWKTDSSNTLVDGFLAHEAQTVVPESVTGTHNETENVSNVVLNAEGNVIDEGVTEDNWQTGKNPILWTDDDTNIPEDVSVGDVKTPARYSADTTWKASHTKDKYQGIDHSKLVPLLVKAVQELEAKVATLEEA
jgi:hypothetical protein